MVLKKLLSIKNKYRKIVKNTRLKKLADHDILNRDAAILYINGEFYLDVTHAACLEQYSRNNNLDINLGTYQFRPDVEIFTQISKDIGPVILGHKVDREDAVFILYGIIDGDMKTYDSIPEQYLKEFEDKFGVKVEDDLKHSDNKSNPYEEDSAKLWQNAKDRLIELSGYGEQLNEVKEFLQQNGFEDKGNCWFDGFTFVKIGGDFDFDKGGRVSCKIESVGGNKKSCYLDELLKELKNIKCEIGDIIKQSGTLNIVYDTFGEAEYYFTNNNGFIFELVYVGKELVFNGVEGIDFFEFSDMLEDPNDLTINDIKFICEYNGGNLT